MQQDLNEGQLVTQVLVQNAALDTSSAVSDYLTNLFIQKQLEPVQVSIPEGVVLGDAQHEVVALTRSVIGYHRSASLNAAGMCVALFRLYVEFAKATGQTPANRSDGSNTVRVQGWPAWVAANFEHLGLNRSSIDNAIRSGQVLTGLCQQSPDTLETFARLSRAAIFSLGIGESSQEVAIEVKQVLENSDRRLTAREIADLRADVERLNREKYELNQEVQKHTQASARMSKQLLEEEQHVIELRDRNAELENAAKTPVEAIVTKLPRGAQTEQDAIDMLNTKKNNLKKEVEQMERRVEGLRSDAQNLERRTESATHGLRTVESLKEEVGQLLLKYSAALLDSLSKSSSSTRAELKVIAESVRGWADAIEPA